MSSDAPLSSDNLQPYTDTHKHVTQGDVHRQTDRQTYTDRQTDRRTQTDRHTDRQTDRQMSSDAPLSSDNLQPYIDTHKHVTQGDVHRQTDRQTYTDRQIYRQTDRQTDR